MRTPWRSICLMLMFVVPAVAVGQPTNLPTPASGAFVVTNTPTKDGVRATADLPASQHHRNTGGSDGEGLCVYTSAWHLAIWQAVSDLYGFRDWMTRRPGGSYPDKFESTLNAYCKEKGIPCPGYVQHTGGDDEFLTLALKTGRMVGVTYCGVDGQGRYGNSVIGHMVNLVHLDDKRAAILDNNFPGTWLWMSRADFLCRWRGVQSDGRPFMGRDGRGRTFPIGGGWAIVLLQSPPPPYPTQPPVQFRSQQCRCRDKCDCPPGACPDCGKGVAAGCICGDSCKCPTDDCPAKCPVIVGQCPGGKCPLPSRTVPSLPNPFGPTFLPAGDPVVPDQMPVEKLPLPNRQPTAYELSFRPGQDYLWRDTPGVGIGWHQINPDKDWGRRPDLPSGWGWVPKKRVEHVPVGAAEDPPFPPGGVMNERITTRTEYRHNGEPSTKELIEAVLNITDDSERWNLTIVGEPNFARKVRDDIATLPIPVRAKLHVQSYAASDWPITQFKLGEGVTLRKPAVNRVGGDVGTVPLADYTASRLSDLLVSEQGPTPKPQPAPSPKPKDPTPAPVVVPDVKPNTPATPNKDDDLGKKEKEAGGGILLLGIVVIAAWLILRKR